MLQKKKKKKKGLLLTYFALQHGFLCEVSICFPTEWARESFITLLITAVTNRIIQMPPRTWTTTWGPGTTISTDSTILKRKKKIKLFLT